MNNKKIKIVSDSSCNMTKLDTIDFCVAPLKIITKEKEYVDDNLLDVGKMVKNLLNYKGRSSTSCPNVGDWLAAFGTADEIYCLTITAALSGSYNSAMLAKQMYENQHPGSRVFVFNSLTTGPEMELLIKKIEKLVLAGDDFDTVCSKLTRYSARTGLIFVLESMNNLANNGRVNPLASKIASTLGIRVVGKASDKGNLDILAKCRGEKRTHDTVVQTLLEHGLAKGTVIISYCQNQNSADILAYRIRKEFENVSIEINKCRGLCSYYAESGGLLIGFEKI